MPEDMAPTIEGGATCLFPTIDYPDCMKYPSLGISRTPTQRLHPNGKLGARRSAVAGESPLDPLEGLLQHVGGPYEAFVRSWKASGSPLNVAAGPRKPSDLGRPIEVLGRSDVRPRRCMNSVGHHGPQQSLLNGAAEPTHQLECGIFVSAFPPGRAEPCVGASISARPPPRPPASLSSDLTIARSTDPSPPRIPIHLCCRTGYLPVFESMPHARDPPPMYRR